MPVTIAFTKALWKDFLEDLQTSQIGRPIRWSLHNELTTFTTWNHSRTYATSARQQTKSTIRHYGSYSIKLWASGTQWWQSRKSSEDNGTSKEAHNHTNAECDAPSLQSSTRWMEPQWLGRLPARTMRTQQQDAEATDKRLYCHMDALSTRTVEDWQSLR